MSMNHHRRFGGPAAVDGTAALAARAGAKRSGSSESWPAGKAAGTRPDNVIQLHPEWGGSRRQRRSLRLMGSEAGMATAEYAIATLAAVGFAGLLVFILRSEEVRGFLLNLIRTALALP